MTSTKTHDPVAAAMALAPQIRAARDEMQSRCRVPKSLFQAGLFQLYVPRVIGGPETDPITAFQAVEELSKVDGSVGWCSFVASAVSIYAGWFPAELGRELFGGPGHSGPQAMPNGLTAATRLAAGGTTSAAWTTPTGCS